MKENQYKVKPMIMKESQLFLDYINYKLPEIIGEKSICSLIEERKHCAFVAYKNRTIRLLVMYPDESFEVSSPISVTEFRLKYADKCKKKGLQTFLDTINRKSADDA